ncbi:MAG: hypothetical protein M9913_02555 [Bryobacteraceae bacterium]|nr:hypothetical protein [Bryobacteraceae bacterium]
MKVEFRRHGLKLAVCRLGAEEAMPAWAAGGGFSAVVRTPGGCGVVSRGWAGAGGGNGGAGLGGD